MKGTRYRTPADVLRRAQEAVGIPLKNIDRSGRLATGKGAVGTVIEEGWFGYRPNPDSEPDFPEAGVELKVTPYLHTDKGIRAKERLVCDLINYMTEHEKTFETSDFWHKCSTLLLMSYEHRPDVPKGEFTIDRAVLFRFPEEDRAIIWERYQRSQHQAGRRQGTGIGLSIVKNAVLLHGGSISVENRPGGGLFFTIVLSR